MALISPFASGDINIQLTSLFRDEPRGGGGYLRSLLHIDAKDMKFTRSDRRNTHGRTGNDGGGVRRQWTDSRSNQLSADGDTQPTPLIISGCLTRGSFIFWISR